MTPLEDDDWTDLPVLDSKCPKCGRFWPRSTGRSRVNTFTGQVVSTSAECGRCGEIEPVVIGWESDFR